MVGGKNLRFLLGWVAKKGCFMGQVVEKEIFKLEQRSYIASGSGEVTENFVGFAMWKNLFEFFWKKYFGGVRN